MNIVRCPSSRRSQLGITSYFTKRPVLNASRFSNVFKSHSSRALRISLSSFLGCDLHSRREKTISLCLCSGGKQRGGAISAMSAKTSSASVSERMAELKQAGRTAFIPFLVACDPSAEATIEALKALDALGADVIELGVPYSDPLADGPTIQAAATRALQLGTTLDRVLNVVRETSPYIKAPIVLFTYFNPIMARGAQKFCQQVKEAGASGLLVPDIPLEETNVIREATSAAGLELVLLATPTTPSDRMRRIADSSEGFVYLVSVTGVTGIRGSMEERVEGLVTSLKGMTDKSIAVGFGVSGPEQAKQIKAWGADGVIVGSALVKALGEAETPQIGLQKMKNLATSIRDAI